MHVICRRGWELPEQFATPEHLFLTRRALIGAGAVLAGSGLLGAAQAAPEVDPSADLYPAKRNERYVLDRPITDEKINGAYNNFYEFGPSKLIAKQDEAIKA